MVTVQGSNMHAKKDCIKNLSFLGQGTMSIKSMKRQTDPYGKAMKK